MKKVLLASLFIFFAMTGFSQTRQSEVDLIQSVLGAQKAQIVFSFVHPAPSQKEAFVKLYNEYEAQRKVLGKERIQLLEEYARQWQQMTNEQADAWMKKVLALSAKRDKLLKKYYKKIKKATDAKVATQFYEVESYILSAVRYTILENIPFIGEK
jgi:hypothetical protein